MHTCILLLCANFRGDMKGGGRPSIPKELKGAYSYIQKKGEGNSKKVFENY